MATIEKAEKSFWTRALTWSNSVPRGHRAMSGTAVLVALGFLALSG